MLYRISIPGPHCTLKLLLPTWHTVAYHMEAKEDLYDGPAVLHFEHLAVDVATHFHDTTPNVEGRTWRITDMQDALLMKLTIDELRGTPTFRRGIARFFTTHSSSNGFA